MTQVFTAEHVLEYPGGYTRSVGPVIGRFLTGLRDGRILGVRLPTAACSCRRPSTTPTTSAAIAPEGDHWIEVGPRGTVQAFTWVTRAAPGQAHAHQSVRVRADPARRRRHRAVAHGRLRQRPTRSRSVRASRRGGARSAPATSPTSRHGSRSATARSPTPAPLHAPAEDEQPVTGDHCADRGSSTRTPRAKRRRATSRVWVKERSSAAGRRQSTEVYAGSRGTDPKTGEPTSIEVEVQRHGRVTTFCVVNIPGLSELAPEIPYVSAQILLDGANNTFFGLIRGCPVDDVHMGMRVKAKWADELKPDHTSIKWWEPTGEPDARLRALQGQSVMRDVAVVSYAASAVAEDALHNEIEMIVPVLHAAVANSGILRKDQIGFVCSGSLDYLQGGPFAFVVGPRRGRRVAADAREPRRDGRRVGALRGVGRNPDRRGRQRARVRLRQVLARRPARDHDAADRPVLRVAVVAVDGRHGCAAGERVPRSDGPERERSRRGCRPFTAQRARQCRRGPFRRRDGGCDLAPAGDASPVARRRHPARSPTARPQSCSRPTIWRARCANAPHGSAASSTASRPTGSASATSRSPSPRRRLPPRPVRTTARSTSPSCTRSSATRS